VFPIYDTAPVRRTPVATWALIGLNVLVFLWEVSLPKETLTQVFYLFGIVPARYAHPAWARAAGFPVDDYWPFVTSMFLHGGWLHIIGNMWTLWLFGDSVEDRMGPGRFLLFYLLSGVVAGATQSAMNPSSTVPTVGASGAIAGVMGAYLLMFPFARIVILVPLLFIPFFFELPAVTYLVFWLLSQIFSGTLHGLSNKAVGGVAWWAHVGGFAAGMLLHRLLVLPSSSRGRPRLQPESTLHQGRHPPGYLPRGYAGNGARGRDPTWPASS